MYGARQEALKLDAYNRGLFSEGICTSFIYIYLLFCSNIILATVITLRQSISKKVC